MDIDNVNKHDDHVLFLLLQNSFQQLYLLCHVTVIISNTP